MARRDDRARMIHLRTFQARLAMPQDRLRRAVLDNNISLISTPVDCIRLRARQNREGDDTSWICERADVISIAFPPLEKVPIRRIRRDKDTRRYQLTSLVSSFEDGEQEKYFTCTSPQAHDVDVKDLIVRVMMDDDVDDSPTVFLLQVAELLGTFGGREVIQQHFNCTIPTDNPPPEIVETIMQMIRRRRAIGW